MFRDLRPPSAPNPPPCEQGEALRKLIAAVEKDGRKKPKRAAAGRALIEAGKASCIARCGGCELTRSPPPDAVPAKACREAVRADIAALEATIRTAPGPAVPLLDRARRDRVVSCRMCGLCKMSRAPITPLSALRRPSSRPRPIAPE